MREALTQNPDNGLHGREDRLRHQQRAAAAPPRIVIVLPPGFFSYVSYVEVSPGTVSDPAWLTQK